MLHTPARLAFEQYLLQRMEQAGSDAIQPARANTNEATRRMQRVFEKRSNLGIVRVYGAIDKGLSELEMECFGGCDLADVDRALAAAESDTSINTVLLEMNTPGGSVVGVPETAARIARLRQRKEVHAFTETMCCSAGIYLASQADHFACTPSATVGSIGVYMAMVDQTRAMEMAGLKVNLMKAGKFKAMGSSFKELTDEERALLQAEVDKIHKDFKAAVTTLRAVKDADMQGQWFNGTEAKARNIVDEVTFKNADEWAAELAA
jgi:protease-4